MSFLWPFRASAAAQASRPADRKAIALLPLSEPVVLEPQRVVMALRALFLELREAHTMEPGQGSGKMARISYEQSAYGGGAPVMRVVLP